MTWLQGIALGMRRRLPVVLQTEAAECALACLAMVATWHGHRIDLAALRRRYPASLKGSTLKSLMELAGRLNLATRAIRLELEDLRRLRCPAVLHWKLDHFVVLKAVRSRSIVVHDPASGERRLRFGEASEAFTGVALELWPDPGFEPRHEKRRVRLRDLVGHVSGFFGSLAQALSLAVVLEVFALVSPLFLQWTVDHVLVSGNLELLHTLAIGFALLVVLQQSISALRAWMLMHFGTMLNVQWHANTFRHLLNLPTSYFEKRHLGDIVSRFRSIDVIQQTLTTAFLTACIDGLMTFVIVIVLFLYSPLLTWVCLGATSVYIVIRWIWYRPLRHATEEQIVHAANQEGHFLETVRGARSIKLFQRQEERRSSWLTLLVDQVNAGLRSQKLQILFQFTNGLLFGIENVLVIWLGASLVLDGGFSVGMLMAYMSYKRQFSSRVSGLIDRFVEVKMLQVQGERLADIVLEPPETPDAGRRLVTDEDTALEPAIVIRGLKFRYGEHDPYVLHGVYLDIAAGESVAIVGPSGCGKTTLLHVMLGILEPTEGSIRIGGVEISHLGTHATHRMIGSVTQGDTLFAGSISDNISFFDAMAEQRRIEECARLAAIHDEIARMPMGYNTLIGHMGSALSGGQQQRVLLARALYRRPRILILDEATSHLDISREIMVNSSIRALDVTRIIVAHRPQTAESADRILTMENGRISDETRTPPHSTSARPDHGRMRTSGAVSA